MIRYGVINQDNELVVYNQDEHRRVYKTLHPTDLFRWINWHPGRYHFKDLVFDYNLEDVIDQED